MIGRTASIFMVLIGLTMAFRSRNIMGCGLGLSSIKFPNNVQLSPQTSSLVVPSLMRHFMSSITIHDASNEYDLVNMKIVDLRELFKRLGGIPGAMRKSELFESCKGLLSIQQYNVSTKIDIRISADSTENIKDPMLKPLDPIVESPLPPSPTKLPEPALIPLPVPQQKLRTLQPMPLPPTPEDPMDRNSSDEVTVKTKFNFPYGQLRDSRFDSMTASDMDITFLGTASCIPSVSRGVSCVALRYQTGFWLFDCGESSQVQMQKSKIKPSKIRKIFLTHNHGDHSFGLPGVLCLMGQATQDERGKADEEGVDLEPVDIYGPEGCRDLIRSIIQLTYSRIATPHRIHELKDVPFMHSRFVKRPPTLAVVRTKCDPQYGEQEGGRDIYPDKNGVYSLYEDDEVTVQAAPLQHTIPCVGYVVKEKSKLGRLKVELVKDLVEKNKEGLVAQLNIKDPRKAFAHLKAMAPGSSFTFPDGTVVHADEVVEPPRRGRKVVIMGDTCRSNLIVPLAQDADILVHEATNAWFREQEGVRYPTYRHLERDTIVHGHSTPEMAGRFAKLINAKRLVLTHFSPRYRGDDGEPFMRTMWRIEAMARVASGMWGANDVVAAWDMMSLPIPMNNSTENDNETDNDTMNGNQNSEGNNNNNNSSNITSSSDSGNRTNPNQSRGSTEGKD